MKVFGRFLPESPRFLIVKGKAEKACKLFRKICDFNKSPVLDDFDERVCRIVEADQKEKVRVCTVLFLVFRRRGGAFKRSARMLCLLEDVP